jgi:O-antigen/teichoic acid export membrane protein
MNIFHRARKNILLKFIAEALVRSLAFFFVIFSARLLGDQAFGKYALAYYLAGILTIFSDWGLNALLIREVSRQPAILGRTAGNILSIKGLLLLGLSALGPLLLWLLGYSREMIFLTFLSLLYLSGNHLLDFMVAVTNSIERMEVELFIKGLSKVLVVAVPLGFLWSGYGLEGFLLALVGCYALSCFLSARIIWKKIVPLTPRWEFSFWKKVLRSGLPLGVSALFMTVYFRMDIVLLSLFKFSSAEIGWYSIPVKIVEMVSLIPYLIMAGVFPIFTALKNQDEESLKKAYQRTLTYLTLAAVPLVLATVFLSDPLLVLLFGPSFSPSVPAMQILIWVIPFIFINYVFFHTLIAINREKMIVWAGGAAVLFNLGLNWFVLPVYGYLGASVTTVMTEVLLSGFYLWHLQRVFLRLPWFRSLTRLIICGGCMALPLWSLRNSPPELVWPLALSAYLAGLLLFGVLTREDWHLLKRMLRFSSADA